MYPLKFKPVYKEKIWGGSTLADHFDRKLPSDSTGESWELAAHKNGSSQIANGQYAGLELMEVIEREGVKLLGTEASEEDFTKFPLLIKLLDANDKLSVQVHPDDQYAAQHENGESGKTEMWYILAAEKNAQLVYGVQPGVNREELATAIEEGRLQEKLREINVKAGDVVYIPSGTVHTIKGGILLAEIQQNSDTTYRVYDWNRVGQDGKPRELHVESALDVINFDEQPEGKVEGLSIEEENCTREILVACPHFITETWDLTEKYQMLADGSRYYILMGLEGSAQLVYETGKVDIAAGETVLIPADLGKYEIRGDCKLICSYQQKLTEFKQRLKQQGISEQRINQIAGL